MRGAFNDNLGQVQSVLIWSLMYIYSTLWQHWFNTNHTEKLQNNLKYEKKHCKKIIATTGLIKTVKSKHNRTSTWSLKIHYEYRNTK